MDLLSKLFTELNNLWARIKTVLAKIPNVEFELPIETKKEIITVEKNSNGSCAKYEMHHTKLNIKFNIGFMVKEGEQKPKLFISANNARMLLQCKYLEAVPNCVVDEQNNSNGEAWFVAVEPINEDYFSETTPEARKDEIIEQLLTGVVKTLDEWGT